MNASITPTVKIAVLVVFAILFATSLIALSVRTYSDRESWDHGTRYDQDTKKFSESFDVAKGGTLRVDTDQGDITVTGGDVSTVEVTVDVRGDEQDVEEFAVKFNRTEDGVEVRGRHRDNVGFHFEWRDFDVHYSVVVPADFNLKLETSGGDIVVSGTRGWVRGGTSGGDIDLSMITGEVRIETSGGDIRLRDITGTVVTETSGGDIDGTTLNGDVQVETSGGNIDLRAVHGKTIASTSGGDVRIELLDNKGLDASSSGGDIVIKFPESLRADIYADATAGSVRCDFAFQGSLEEGTLQGTIGGGGQKVRAETSGGDISIRKIQ
jgi:DUF4097 and DUF4098 domain-containing protein YvlB